MTRNDLQATSSNRPAAPHRPILLRVQQTGTSVSGGARAACAKRWFRKFNSDGFRLCEISCQSERTPKKKPPNRSTSPLCSSLSGVPAAARAHALIRGADSVVMQHTIRCTTLHTIGSTVWGSGVWRNHPVGCLTSDTSKSPFWSSLSAAPAAAKADAAVVDDDSDKEDVDSDASDLQRKGGGGVGNGQREG